MKDRYIPLHGWLALDKPLGLSSAQALARVRHALRAAKAGHGGTLDPLATGVLPLAFGEATKLIPYVMDADKDYDFTIRWGEKRATADAEGDIVARSDLRPALAAIQAALPRFTGIIMQTPPVYSAIKIGGQRAYDLARAGAAPALAARQVTVHRLELVAAPDADHAQFHVRCGKGLYVRALAEDIAASLGTCGYIAALRRTRVGCFKIDDALPLAEVQRLAAAEQPVSWLRPLHSVLGDLPVLPVNEPDARHLRQGRTITIRPEHGVVENRGVRLAMENNVPIALVIAEDGSWRVQRGFCF